MTPSFPYAPCCAPLTPTTAQSNARAEDIPWALAAPDKERQYPKYPPTFVAKTGPEWKGPPALTYIHALSLSRQRPHAVPVREFPVEHSKQWRALTGTEEEQAAIRYRSPLPVTLVEHIPDIPFSMQEKEGERGSQEEADAQTGADDRHFWGAAHKNKTIAATHRGWIQGAVSDDRLCRVILEYATFLLRSKWARLGDDIPDVVQLATLNLFGALKKDSALKLNRKLIKKRAGRDAQDWRAHVHFDHETKCCVQDEEDGSETVTVVDEDDLIPADADAAPFRPDCDLRLLHKLLAQLPEDQRLVVEMRLDRKDYKAITGALGCSRHRVKTLESKAIAAMRAAQ